MSQTNNEKPESRHSATDPEKCYQMERKYGWKLLRVEKTKHQTLKVDCVFEGETEFPKYQQED
ncbi:hypothetical protein LAY41_21200 [Argonema galeatum A003/A1]|nr:hypothetical protein [Argonema galeatum A003/A1]